MLVSTLLGGLAFAGLVAARLCCRRLRRHRRAAAHARHVASATAAAYAATLSGHDPPTLDLPPSHRRAAPRRWLWLHRPAAVGITAATAVTLALILVPVTAPGTTQVRVDVPGARQGMAAPVPEVTPSGPRHTSEPAASPTPDRSPPPPAGPGRQTPAAPAATGPTGGAGGGGATPTTGGPGDGGAAPTTQPPPAQPTASPAPPDGGGNDPLLACVRLLGLELCV